MKKSFLNELTLDAIQTNPFPIKEVLENSVYYPASGVDGGLIRDINRNRQDWNVTSFVYCDYHETAENLRDSIQQMRGYKLLAWRDLKMEELIPEGWSQQLPPNIDLRRYQDRVRRFANPNPYGVWMVFERLPEFGEDHGPRRFSLLYICAEGVASYQALYWTNHCVPRAIAIIQPGTGFGFNWTDFYKDGEPLHWIVKNHPEGMPEYVFTGHYSDSATSAAVRYGKHFNFNWPEYGFLMPAVGYPEHEVIIMGKNHNE